MDSQWPLLVGQGVWRWPLKTLSLATLWPARGSIAPGPSGRRSHQEEEGEPTRPTRRASETHSTMRVRAEAADIGARVVLDNVRVPELQAHIVAFLADPLEWRNMAVAARYGRLSLLELLGTARTHLPASNRSRSADLCPGPRVVVCTSDAMQMAAAHGHLGVVKWLHTHTAMR